MKRLLAVFLVVLMLVGCSSAPSEESTKKIEELQATIKNHEKTIEELNQKVQKAEKEYQDTYEIGTKLFTKLNDLGYIQENEDGSLSILDNPKSATPADAVLSVGEWWEVPGLWKLRIDSVKVTKERNRFSDKKPAEVVIITYTYENLGYDGSIQDLYIKPERVVDEARIVASTYPADTKSAQPTPIGAIMDKAQVAYGLENESSEITIIFEEFGNDYDKHRVTFKVNVTK